MAQSPRGILTSTFVASLLFVGLLLAPLFFADVVEQGELDDFFSLGGTSDIAIVGVETDANLGTHIALETFPNNAPLGDWWVECQRTGASSVREAVAGSTTNTSTNLTFFGSSYASFVASYRGNTPNENHFQTPDSNGDASVVAPKLYCRQTFYMNITMADLETAEGLKFVLHEDTNQTYDFTTLRIQEFDTAGVKVHDLSLHHNAIKYDTGDLVEFPITTLDRLQAKGIFGTVPATNTLVLSIQVWGDVLDMPADADVLVWDAELTEARQGFLDNEGKIIAFNIGYVLIGGLMVVVATPWVRWDDLFGGKGRMGRKGVNTSMGAMIIAALAVVGFTFFFGGGSLGGFFTASLLPLSLAVVAIALVSMTTRGKSKPAFVWIMAGLAGVVGWMAGITVQNNWIPYDALYVVSFVDVVTGNVSVTSAFAISAFFVIIVQIAGTLVALFNIMQTINTDDTVSLVQ